ncbi:MAG: ECF transporter S component [Faecousia sp.]
MKKSRVALLLIVFLLIPLTLWLGRKLPGRWYYFTGTLIVIEILIPFFLAFEGRKPQARHLVTIAVMCALAVASRVVVPIPHFKPIFAIIMLTGVAFGPEAGFLVGAVSAFASNFFYGQGPYMPWQMLGYGMAGFLAGFAFGKHRLPRKPVIMGIFGFLAVLLVVGPILDTSSVFLTLPQFTAGGVLAIYLSGIPVNLSQGLCTFLTMLLFANPLLEKLDRVKEKYGMMEDENGL